MDPTDLARTCKALGDPTRVRIFLFLLECSGQVAVDEQGIVRPVCGPTVGEVCCRITGIEKITSTISFHLKELREAGLIKMEKQGKNMLCSVNRPTISKLAETFQIALNQTAACC